MEAAMNGHTAAPRRSPGWMSKPLHVLSLYLEFFAGGARILHSEVLGQLQQSYRQRHRVLCIRRETYREHTVQKMEDDTCYRALVRAGIPVTTFGHRWNGVPGRIDFSDAELELYGQQARAADVVLSLKEQPIELVNAAAAVDRPVIVCLHRSDPENQGPAVQWLRGAVASGQVTACTVSASSARDAYVAAGLPATKLHVITNGIDMDRFCPSPERRRRIRQELHIPDDAPVVIFAARYDAMKNVPLFLRAARLYLRRCSAAHVIMCGGGMAAGNDHLRQAAAEAFDDARDLTGRIHLLGIRADMEALHAASDIVSSTSRTGETYPLCLLEGMACGAVAVATEVGDTRAMLSGGRGILTPADGYAIARAWEEALARRAELRLRDADRARFDRRKMVDAYARVITEAT